MEIPLIVIGIFGLVWGFLFLLLAPKTASEEEVVQKRVAIITGTGRQLSLTGGDEKESIWESLAKFFLGEKALTDKKYTTTRVLLHQAGYPGERAVLIFWGVRIFLAIAFAAGALFLTALSTAPFAKMLGVVAAAAFAGYSLPNLQIRRKARFRIRDIRETFPDTLDLFVICVEAGMGVDAALVRVANEQVDQGLAIGEEFQLLSRELQAGITRREALARMGDRLDIEELRSLAVFLIQTEELGGSIARSLRIYADSMRHKRRQKAEEAARKMVIKLLFPLALFILPALFLVIMGPPAINIAKLVGHMGK